LFYDQGVLKIKFKKKIREGLGGSPVVECLPSMHDACGSGFHPKHYKKKQRERERERERDVKNQGNLSQNTAPHRQRTSLSASGVRTVPMPLSNQFLERGMGLL
jgi:hypothetical protein